MQGPGLYPSINRTDANANDHCRFFGLQPLHSRVAEVAADLSLTAATLFDSKNFVSLDGNLCLLYFHASPDYFALLIRYWLYSVAQSAQPALLLQSSLIIGEGLSKCL
jgi:hypothetical protein